MLRDNLGQFAKSKRLWKLIGLLAIIGLVWFGVHMFFSLYTIQHQRGIYGIVSKNTYNSLIEDHAEAVIWRATPVSAINENW